MGFIILSMTQQTDRVAEIEVSYRPAISRKPIVHKSIDSFIELIEFFPPETIALNERFMVMYLNRGCRVLGVYEISKGGITGTIVDLRLLISVALKIAATSIILCHNHPSCNLTPSPQDLVVTLKIKEACKLFDIQVRDHLIISPDRQFLSMADEGIL